MITLGIINSINIDSIAVRLPVFEASGSNENQILNCSICYNPGNLKGYKVGDIVYVGFENNQIDKPVVLGKLYKGEEEASNYSLANSLKVTENATLPYNTTIGNLDFSEIKSIFNEIMQLKDYINQLKKEIEALKDKE